MIIYSNSRQFPTEPQRRRQRRLRLQDHYDDRGRLLPRLMLPTRSAILQLRKAVQSDERWIELVDEDVLFDSLLEHLSQEREAEMLIPVFAMEVSEIFIGAGEDVLYRHLDVFAREIYEVLKDLRVYRGGYLPYFYDQLWGNDMLVLEDLDWLG